MSIACVAFSRESIARRLNGEKSPPRSKLFLLSTAQSLTAPSLLPFRAPSPLRARASTAIAAFSFGLSATLSAAALLAVLAASTPALAGGGAGGVGLGGGGGSDSGTGAGGTGGNSPFFFGGGGGGGAGATGGAGGAGGNGASGGSGGASAGAPGHAGDPDTAGGGGGGGGAHGYVGAALPGAAATGGNGGKGGNGPNAADAGGGGAGGYGAVVTGSGNLGTLGVGVTGGSGGAGGDADAFSGGSGGSGGVGVLFDNAAGATVTINAAIAGGGGGAGGAGGGSGGSGGVGIVGQNLNLTVGGTGSVSGGSGANAINFTGGTNALEIQGGSTISGKVAAFSSLDTFRLGGATNSSFSLSSIGTQYVGFGVFEKSGTSTYSLTGTAPGTDWNVQAGGLTFADTTTQALGNVTNSGTIIVNANAIVTMTGLTNNLGGHVTNNGTLTDDLDNAGQVDNNGNYNAAVATNTGTINNNSPGVWTGAVLSNTTGSITNFNGATWVGNANNNGGTLVNGGTWTGGVSNSGTFNNDGTVSGLVTNTAGTTYNSSGGTVASLNNTGGTFTNAGLINGGANVSGGTLNTSGTVNGGLINSATVNASGQVNGAINNNLNGVFTVNAALASNNVFNNATGAQLKVVGGNYTGITTLTNFGTVDIGAGRTLSAGAIDNNAGSIKVGAGATLQGTANTLNNSTVIDVATGGNVTDAGAINNLSGGIINFNGPGGTATATSGIGPSLGFNNNLGAFVNVIDGHLTINGGAVTNAGQFNLTSTNSGIVTANTAFNNAATGIIDLRNGKPIQTFRVNGTYTGTAGSVLGVDLNAATGLADKLATADAAGTTTVNFNKIQNGFIGSPIVVVSQSANSAADTFLTGSGLTPSGIITYNFGKQGNNWVVSSTLDPAGSASIVTNVAGALSMLASGFHEPVSNFVTYKKGAPDDVACGLWARADGGRYDIDSSTALNLNGSSSLGEFASKQRLSYKGGQVGFDCASLNMSSSGWNGHLGVTGGQIDGDIKQLNGIGSTDLDIPFAGAYAFLTNGSFTFDLTVRRDWDGLKFTNPLAGLAKTKVDGDATTVAGVALYRADLGGGLFLAPHAGLSWTRFELDEFRINSGGVLGTVAAGSDEALLGKVGLQLSYVHQLARNTYVVPFGSVTVWRNFEKSTDLSLTFDNLGSGANVIGADTEGPETFAQYTAGISFTEASAGVSGYVQGSWREGSNISGGSLTGGGRVNF